MKMHDNKERPFKILFMYSLVRTKQYEEKFDILVSSNLNPSLNIPFIFSVGILVSFKNCDLFIISIILLCNNCL